MKPINPETLAEPRGYNNGMLAVTGKIVFVAGQIGWDCDRKLAAGFTAQFEHALLNVLEVVRSAGGNPESIGRLTIFITNKKEYISQRKAVGVVYRKHMRNHYPAMSLVVVKDLLEDGAQVEMEATAVLS